LQELFNNPLFPKGSAATPANFFYIRKATILRKRGFMVTMKKLAGLFLLLLVLLVGNTGYADGEATDASAAPPETGAVEPTGSLTAPPEAILTDPVTIVHPAENTKLPALAATYVCGSAPPDGKLTLNGQPVPIHPGGGFVAMVDLTPGEFVIRAVFTLGATTYQTIRTVWVADPEQPAPVTPLTIEDVTPGQDQELAPGDAVTVTCKGSPGMTAYFTVAGVEQKFPLLEAPTGMKGIYQGIYRVGPQDRLNKSNVSVTLESPDETVTQTATGALSLFSQDALPVIAEVCAPDAVLRAGPALGPYNKAGYLMFPPAGTLLQLTGRVANEYRVRLNDSQTVWVSADQVKRAPQGTPTPRTVVGNLTVNRIADTVQIRLPLECPVPFRIDPDSQGKYLDLSLFGAFSNTDRIANTVTGIVKQVSWFQDDRDTYRLRINTAPDSWWGYDVRYEGRELVLELRTPPPLAAGNNPLAGLVIAVDAGHGAGGGAIGATGYAEGDANLATALLLREYLSAKGARVIMTRPADLDTPLGDRPKIAWQNRADILISLHNNALGYGGNPLRKHGFEVYYFTPMSFGLAEAVHAAYGEAFGAGSRFELPDGGLFYGNLAVTRAPQMPSVLVESAYMIYPAEEAYLKTEAFRSACAAAIVKGLERYAGRMRPVIVPAKPLPVPGASPNP
jgi:N-acetylmuramoyl-L-alanine amidase